MPSEVGSVLVYTQSFPDSANSYRGIFVRDQLHALRDYSEHSFTLVAPIPAQGLPRAAVIDETGVYLSEAVCVYRPLYPYLTIPKVSVPFRGWLMWRWSQPIIARLHREQPFDLVHVHFAYPAGFAIPYLKESLNRPVVLTVHGSDILRYPRYPFLGGMIRRAIKAVDRITCVSEYLINAVVALGAERSKVCVIPNGIDWEFYQRDWAHHHITGSKEPEFSRMKRLLFVGGLSRKKGIDLALKAVALLGGCDSYVLDIIGRGPLAGSLQKQSAVLGIAQRVNFRGSVSHKEVANWMHRADLVVIPSRYEGFGVVAIEAMATGTPVVAANCPGGLPSLVSPEVGVLFETENPVALAEAIERALEHTWDPEAIRNYARQFDWSNVTQSIDAVYRMMLPSRYHY